MFRNGALLNMLAASLFVFSGFWLMRILGDVARRQQQRSAHLAEGGLPA